MSWSLLALLAAFPLKSLVDWDGAATFDAFAVLSLPKLAGAAFAVLLAAHLWRQPAAYRFDRSHALLFGMLALSCLSIISAALPLTAVVTTFRYAAYVLLYVGLCSLAVEPAARLRVIVALVGSCAVASVVAVGMLLARRVLVATTPFGDANDLAFLLASVLPVAIWLVATRGVPRVVAAAMTLAIGLATVLTFSRGALVGLAAGVAWLVVVERRGLRAVALGAGLAVAIGAVLVFANAERLRESVEAKRVVGNANVTNRLAAWQFATRLALDHPLLGVGPGNFGHHYEDYWRAHPDAHRLRVVHNSYLEIAAENGVPALGAFSAFLLLAFRRARAVASRAAAEATLGVALRVALVIAVVGGAFVSVQLAAPFWVLAGLATAVWNATTSGTATP